MVLSLLPQLAAAADTLLVRQLPPVRSGFEQVVFIASGITSILVLILLVLVIVALGALRNKTDETRQKLDDLLMELRPMASSANLMIADVREVASSAKEVVEDTAETIHETNARIRATVEGLADRVDDLGEMLGRIHASAERVASVAGTAVGGIKAGARIFGIGKKRKKKPKRTREAADRPRLRRRD